MTKISTYNLAEKITALDKWIGSDVNQQNRTKNFTPKKLAEYFNEDQIINIGVPLQYKYYTLDPGEQRPRGTLSFETEVGQTVNFSSITTFLLSKYTEKQNIVSDFLNFLNGSKVLLFKSSDINSFGFYEITSIEPYETDPNFFVVTVQYETGNGFMQEDNDYMLSLVSLPQGSVPTKTSDLINDGQDGVHPFISEEDINRTEWDAAYDGKINSAEVTGTSTKTLTLTKQDGGTIITSWVDQGSDLELTTFGTSGPSTLIDGILNVPNYTSENIELTTIGISGPATLINGILNVPDYTLPQDAFVTYVNQLTIGTTGNDLNSSVANPSTTPTITLNVPTASATKRGALSSTDWTTFNNKQPPGSYLTNLTGDVVADGPGSYAVTLSSSVITSKLITGVNITGGSITASDSMLIAFGKLQNQINGIVGGATYQGTWDASTNNPTLTSGIGTNGFYYIVSVAGSTNLDGITDWKIGDWAIFSGSSWQKVDNTDSVISVNGQVGIVSLTTDNISEGLNNLYYTNARTIGSTLTGFTSGAGVVTSSDSILSAIQKLDGNISGGYVPYTGASNNVNLGEWGLKTGNYQFDLTPTNIPATLGTMYWDSFYRTVSLIDGTGTTTLQIGQEERTLVHNNTGSPLVDGQIVYITGSTGELPSVALASNASEATSSVTFGMVTETIANGSDGFITTSGIVHGLNTLAYTEGLAVWLGSTPGTITQTKPVAPANSVLVGYVVKKSGSNGSVFIKIQNGYELDELHDVLLNDPQTNQILAYESSPFALWKNKTIPDVLGYIPADDANVVHLTGNETIGGVKTFNSNIIVGGTTTVGTDDIYGTSVIIGQGANCKIGGVSIGRLVGSNLTIGEANVGVGSTSLLYVNSGSGNVAIGTAALSNVTTGDENIGVGQAAGNSITTGSRNIHIGVNNLTFNSRITTGNANVIIGNLIDTIPIDTSNNVIITDGDGNKRFWYDGTNLRLFGNLKVEGQARSIYSEDIAVTGTKTLNFNEGNIAFYTLIGSTTITLSNAIAGSVYTIRLTQGNSGSNLVTWSPTVKWGGGTAPTLSTAVGAIDIVTLLYDGTNYYGNIIKNFA